MHEPMKVKFIELCLHTSDRGVDTFGIFQFKNLINSILLFWGGRIS